MNNLKRILSLGLSGTMLASLMIAGASAADVKDFTDASEIKNQEAVTTMAALGVIKGKDTGAFDPKATVTRAEMAKMITIMLNGGKDPVLGVKTTPSYTDIKGHWAESYIEYCTSNGIIAGQGDGTFAPDATVTGSAAAKMTMVALGYDPSVYGFTGVDWEINTNRNANAPDADLYDDLTGINPSEGLSRDNAAQMLYNALDAKTKVMTPTSNTNGTVEYTYTNGDSMMEAKFNAVKVEGVVEANEVADLTSKADKGSSLDTDRTRLAITNYGTGKDEQDDFKNTLTIKAATGLDDLGRSVNVYVKKDSSSSKAEILGTVITSTDNVVVTDYSSDSINDVADDNNLDVVDATMTAANYQGRTALKSADAKADGIRGVEKVLIDNDDDGDLDYVLLNTYAFGKVTSYVTSGDGSMTVSADKSLTASDKDDVVGFENVAKNDYVLAAYIGGNLYVEKAETVTGNLDSYKTADIKDANGNVTGTNTTKLEVDGTNYNVSWIAGYTAGTDDITAATDYGKNNLDTEATFYLGKGDYIAAVGEVVENAYNYALVLGVGNGIDDQVKVALSDGTVGTYTVNTNGNTYNEDNLTKDDKSEYFGIGSVCTYSIGSNGKIKLTEATSTDLTAAKFTKGKTALVDSTTKGYTNSNTAFFYVDMTKTDFDKATTIASKKVDTYIGYASAPSLTGAKGLYITNKANRIVAVLFVGENITTANVDDNLYIYSVGNTNNDYTTVKAFVAGSTEPVTDLKVDSGSDAVKGVYTYTINSDKYYEIDKPDSYVAGSKGNLLTDDSKTNDITVESANSKTFVVKDLDGKMYELKIDADTLLVDDSAYLDDPTAELGAGPQEGDKLAYVLFDLDDKFADTAKLVVVKNPENGSSTTPVTPTDDFTGTDVAAVSNTAGTVTVKYHSTTNTVAASALTSLIKAADSTIKTVNTSGYTASGVTGTVTVTNADGDTYALTVVGERYFEVKYNGKSYGYFNTTKDADKDFDITATAATVGVIDGVNVKAGTADRSAVAGKIAMDVSALTADVDYYDAYKLTISDAGTIMKTGFPTANGDAVASTNLVKVGASVVVTATDEDATHDVLKADDGASDFATVTAPEAGEFTMTFTMPAKDVTVTATKN